ncbi:MAG: acetyl-CoA carboxylase biotin carboxyl carrier protein [Candidatus Eremiobacteraeota bacterium]|nr:acetyl-CoA carboxylase biotin carboxyl carrier protein [Candidatus Eremiobacteraeota bacterium]
MHEESKEPAASETQTIKELLDIMHENDLDAIKVKMGDQTFELVRREAGLAMPAIPAYQGTPVAASPGGTPAGPVAPANVKRIVAPLVGVFYSAPAPGAEAFVNIGERVQEGQVICILEAMKLMNEITSDYSGIVTRVIPENGELVSLGEELFWIEP